MMIHMYLQTLQQYNIDLNLSYLREMSSSPMEAYLWSNLFSHFHVPLCYFHRLAVHTMQTLPCSYSCQPICTLRKLSVAPHLFLQSSPSPALPIPALALDGWSVLQETLSFLFLTEKQTKHQPFQQNPRKHPLLHLQVVATCGMSGVGCYRAFFFSSL